MYYVAFLILIVIILLALFGIVYNARAINQERKFRRELFMSPAELKLTRDLRIKHIHKRLPKISVNIPMGFNENKIDKLLVFTIVLFIVSYFVIGLAGMLK